MAIQTINTGTSPNDGTGDPLRTALDKVNDNFTDTTNAASYNVTASTTDTSNGDNGQPRLVRVGDNAETAFGLGSIVSEDYEEGTWTPTITSSSGGFTATYTTQIGYYTKIGNVCYYRLFAYLSGITASAGGNFRVTLPFIAGGSYSYAKAVADLRFVNWDAGSLVSAASVQGQANLTVNQQVSGGASTELSVDDLLANSQFEISGFFFTS